MTTDGPRQRYASPRCAPPTVAKVRPAPAAWPGAADGRTEGARGLRPLRKRVDRKSVGVDGAEGARAGRGAGGRIPSGRRGARNLQGVALELGSEGGGRGGVSQEGGPLQAGGLRESRQGGARANCMCRERRGGQGGRAAGVNS